jgi:hypothetical protein
MAEDKKVEVNESDLKELIAQNREFKARIEGLEASESSVKKVVKRTKHNEVNVSFIDGKPVIGFINKGVENRPKYVYSTPDPLNPTQTIEFVDVIVKGSTEPLKVNYLQFIRDSEKRMCKVLETNEEIWEIEQGETVKREVIDYASVETGIVVPVTIEGKVRTFVVDIDGEKVEINEKYVNM